jgi:hypothetical protein
MIKLGRNIAKQSYRYNVKTRNIRMFNLSFISKNIFISNNINNKYNIRCFSTKDNKEDSSNTNTTDKDSAETESNQG